MISLTLGYFSINFPINPRKEKAKKKKEKKNHFRFRCNLHWTFSSGNKTHPSTINGKS